MTTSLNSQEISILEKRLKGNLSFIFKTVLAALLLGTGSLFVPLDLLRRAKRSGVTGSLVDSNGFVFPFIFLLLLLLLIGGLQYYFSIIPIKKDLNLKEKVSEKVLVKRIEHLSASVTRHLEGNEDTILHFEKGKYKVKKFYFNKQLHPEYLNAKEVLIEKSKYSNVEFKSKIVS